MILQRSFIVLVTVILLSTSYNVKCSEYTVSPDKGPFTDQVINITEKAPKSSEFITIFVLSGNYTTTNGTPNNFIAFHNVSILKHPNSSDPVFIMCPGFIKVSYNGIGFENSLNIFISGLSFLKCGTTTAGLYSYNTVNLTITDSTFHHNVENGIQIISGNNIKIINCHFYRNVGLQPDNTSRLITKSNVNATGGVGLGILLANISDVSISIVNCTFNDNISYKTVNFSNDTRPFAFIPSGSGGGLDIQMDKVTNLYAKVTDCNFYKNTAIHQGGGIVITVVDSVNSTINVSRSNFIGNKALGYFLRNFNGTIDFNNIDSFIDDVNANFANISEMLPNTSNPYVDLYSSGGFGGAIAMSLYENAAYNELVVTDSYFSENMAIFAGSIGFIVRDSLSDVDSAFLNRAIISK